MHKMVKPRDVFAMPGTAIDLLWDIRDQWFPELPSLDIGEGLLEIVSEGRLQINCVVSRMYDGDRFADIHTVVFDNNPVMITRDGGRSGRDYQDRLIVDQKAFEALCQYIRQKSGIDTPTKDLVSIDKEMYPEDMFNFYGVDDFAADLGYEVAVPKTDEKGDKLYMLFVDVKSIIPGCNPEHYLLQAHENTQMPVYVRRRGFVMQRLRPLTDEELGRNPRVEARGRELGYVQHWWYEACEHPVAYEIVVV